MFENIKKSNITVKRVRIKRSTRFELAIQTNTGCFVCQAGFQESIKRDFQMLAFSLGSFVKFWSEFCKRCCGVFRRTSGFFINLCETCEFSFELCVQVFFKLIDLMGRGVDWSLVDVQFVRDGTANGANLSLLARTRDSKRSLSFRAGKTHERSNTSVVTHTRDTHKRHTHRHTHECTASPHHMQGSFLVEVVRFITPSVPFQKLN